MKREKDVWDRFKQHLPPMFSRRIEDASGNLGTYDTFLARNGRSAWLELKFAGPNAKPDLRPGQAAFGLALSNEKIPCGYLIGHGDGSIRVIGPRLMDPADWRDHLEFRRDVLDAEAVQAVLRYLMLN
jgi:hypothetical protein